MNLLFMNLGEKSHFHENRQYFWNYFEIKEH